MKSRISISTSFCVALAALFGSGALASVPAEPTSLTRFEPGSDKAAKQQLDDAKALRRAAGKKAGEERRKALAEAATAYRKVVTENPDQTRACAEAAFRAGEIERSLGEIEKARESFRAAVEHGKDAPQFGSRAMSELAHLERRAEKLEEALATYRKIPETFPGQDAEGARAITWAGKMESKLGRAEDARKTWLSIGDRFPAQPILAIRAADLAALSLLEAGDVAGAQKVVSDVEARFGEDNKNQPWWTPQVDETLAKMRIHAKLAGSSANVDADDDGDDDEN